MVSGVELIAPIPDFSSMRNSSPATAPSTDLQSQLNHRVVLRREQNGRVVEFWRG